MKYVCLLDARNCIMIDVLCNSCFDYHITFLICMHAFIHAFIFLIKYQVIRGNELNAAAGLLAEGRAVSVQADFMKLPFPDNHFDGVYAIEATCHAPVREDVYSQIYRVLKPGQVFACYEWCLTPLYDGDNSLHR